MTETLTDKDLLIMDFYYRETDTELWIRNHWERAIHRELQAQTDKEILTLTYDRGTTDAYSLIQIYW